MLVFEAQWSRYDEQNNREAPMVLNNPEVPLFFETEERCRRWLEWLAAQTWVERFFDDFPSLEWSDTDKGLAIWFSDPYNPNYIFWFECVTHASEDEGW